MFSLIKELFSLLAPGQRKRFYSLQILVVLMAIMELFGIAAIGPFMALVADIGLLETNLIFSKLYQLSGLNDPYDFLFLAGVIVLSMLALASAVSMYTTWRLSLFAFDVGTEISDRLYHYYLTQSWLFHASGSSAQLTKQIATETARVTQQIIRPLTRLNARVFLTFIISVALFAYNPAVALGGLLLFASGYLVIYKLVRKRIIRHGKNVSTTNTKRFRLMNEGFGGIKDILLLNRSENFISQFNRSGKTLARAQGVNAALSETPRYFMELLAFGAIIGLVLVLLKQHDGLLSQVLPVLAVYSLAGFKLLPALQQIYASVTQIKGNAAAFEAIKPDLVASAPQLADDFKYLAPEEIKFSLKSSDYIALQNVSFTYPKKEKPALCNVNISIPANSVVAFVGESGSGKSTAVDLLLGLIEPNEGCLLVGGTPITAHNKAAWQANIGFVPQNIFLSEGSIIENVAFGLDPKKVDLSKVRQAVKLAHLEELVEGLADGLDTKVGERGVQLSGGQRQRIGIARALYNQADVLVFDEATSALDGITEKVIMDAIHELSGERTIILIAHRLKTVQKCDTIYFMERGAVVDQGSYTELLERNQKFRQMARFS